MTTRQEQLMPSPSSEVMGAYTLLALGNETTKRASDWENTVKELDSSQSS